MMVSPRVEQRRSIEVPQSVKPVLPGGRHASARQRQLPRPLIEYRAPCRRAVPAVDDQTRRHQFALRFLPRQRHGYRRITLDVLREHRATPLFKLYLINNEEAFFGFYPVREHIITLGGTPRAIYDIMGKDAILFHHSINDDDTSTGSQYVDQARTWYDSVWNTIATEFTR